MTLRSLLGALAFVAAATALPVAQQQAPARQPPPARPPQTQTENEQAFKFRTGVELINVTATVTDAAGRFVPGLTRDDFRLFDDDRPQPITHFSAERVPVSLGIVLDTSGSMDGEKMYAARDALNRFLFQLLDADDEVFLYRFDTEPELVMGWTKDKRRVADALGQIRPRGGTALYDAVADAVQMAQHGHNQKKAVVIISDGNDTNSRTDVQSVKQLIRETEVLVYAIGIDGSGPTYVSSQYPVQRPPRSPMPFPFPIPGGRRPTSPPQGPTGGGGGGGRWGSGRNDDRVNVAALRDITDDSGGRTEIVRWARDLDPAPAGIADELSRQYYMGYAAPDDKDGRWHTIRVDVHGNGLHIRARRGYVATRQ